MRLARCLPTHFSSERFLYAAPCSCEGSWPRADCEDSTQTASIWNPVNLEPSDLNNLRQRELFYPSGRKSCTTCISTEKLANQLHIIPHLDRTPPTPLIRLIGLCLSTVDWVLRSALNHASNPAAKPPNEELFGILA